MAAAIRIKLGDLLKILSDWPQEAPRPRKKQPRTISSARIEEDMEAIRRYLQASGPTTRRDLSVELHMHDHFTLYRLNLLKERGVIVDLPGYKYGLAEDLQ